MSAKMPAVVLISGRGSNLGALIHAVVQEQLPLNLSAVISNRPDAAGLERATQAGIAAECLDHTTFSTREDFDRALAERVDHYQPGLILLAGFMRVLGAGFVARYVGCVLNIHPSLLPGLPGLHTHERALSAGLREHGATVHFVTNDLDGGPLIVQARVPVLPDDDAERLAARVLNQEHCIYPLAARWFAEGRLKMQDDQAWLDDKPLREPVQVRDCRLDAATLPT